MGGNAVGPLFHINLYVIFCSDSLLPCPVPLLATLAFSIRVIQSIRNIQHVIPPPPNFYQSRQACWGNPYAAANSDDDSDDMSAAASNPTVTVAGLTTKALSVIVNTSAVVADKYSEYNTIANATITITDSPIIDGNAHIGNEHAVIADVDAVPANNYSEEYIIEFNYDNGSFCCVSVSPYQLFEELSEFGFLSVAYI